MLKRVFDYCDGFGFDEIYLWILKGFDVVCVFYEKYGFEFIDEYIGD